MFAQSYDPLGCRAIDGDALGFEQLLAADRDRLPGHDGSNAQAGRDAQLAGRQRLDVLLLGPGGGLVVRAPGLTVPHPRLHERAFALRPLLDLDEGLRYPLTGAPLAALYAARLAEDGAAPRPVPGGPWTPAR